MRRMSVSGRRPVIKAESRYRISPMIPLSSSFFSPDGVCAETIPCRPDSRKGEKHRLDRGVPPQYNGIDGKACREGTP